MLSSQKLSDYNLGDPTIFIDSHPEEQGGLLYSWWSGIRDNIKISITGEVPERIMYPVQPGKLRIMWYTTDGKEGQKDYALLQHDLVRNKYDELLEMPEIRRVCIMGYSGQNPYFGANAFVEAEEEFENEQRREAERAQKRAKLNGGAKPPLAADTGDLKIDRIIGKIEEADREAEERRLEEIGKEDV